MAIEKAFAINANPHVIYRALLDDIEGAGTHEGDTFAVIHRDPGRSLSLRVTMSGMPCELRYTLHDRGDHTEVVATVQPYGWRYTTFRIMTLGMRDQGFEIALFEGLANLKASVEGTAFPDEQDSMIVTPADE